MLSNTSISPLVTLHVTCDCCLWLQGLENCHIHTFFLILSHQTPMATLLSPNQNKWGGLPTELSAKHLVQRVEEIIFFPRKYYHLFWEERWFLKDGRLAITKKIACIILYSFRGRKSVGFCQPAGCLSKNKQRLRECRNKMVPTAFYSFRDKNKATAS